MITKVEKVDDSSFLINETVKVTFKTIDDPEDPIMEIEFDDSLLTEQEASDLANELIKIALENHNKKMESEGFKEVL